MNNNDDFKKFIDRILKDNPELKNFNLDFLKDINEDDVNEILDKLKIASEKFIKSEQKATKKAYEIIDFKDEDLVIDYDSYLKTIISFPFALAVGEDILNNESTSGIYKGFYFGNEISFEYDDIFELITIKRIVAMDIATIIRKHFMKFLYFKNKLKNYLEDIVYQYLKVFGFSEDIDIFELREFNFVVRLKPKHYDSFEDMFDDLIEDKSEKFKLMKAYLITEFSIAIID
ncbi:hypothetical protein OF820_02815 [Oceanotoga sp. DSM 15011]|uniref:hypothetical protein n=1 Tax=unclassified Oceanotoga TaxID=2618448 RepID=UPI0021F465B6|nr:MULTISPECIES: hypothetical protein [unclassified Oceanotoga]MDN5343061.1 hypothetical protein [Oceanotoga sp.]UYP00625.1 hypothetical protein OF820_02815 [Oceanotoga sp. DSM 15011]